jgi:ubiquinone/menaquinone biosynthesis C-methylase UbiE
MKQKKLKQKYKGEIAENYEFKRIHDPKWKRENNVINLILRKISNGKKRNILDIPVGTGRFFEIYKDLNLNVTGADVSGDMLRQAEKKAHQLNLPVQLKIKDVTHINSPDKTYDIALCIRLFNWLDKKNLKNALRELNRVSKKHVIVGIRTYNKRIKIKSRILSLKREVGSWLRKSTRIYNEKDFLRLLPSANLKILERVLIDSGKREDSYYIYHLIKS